MQIGSVLKRGEVDVLATQDGQHGEARDVHVVELTDIACPGYANTERRCHAHLVFELHLSKPLDSKFLRVLIYNIYNSVVVRAEQDEVLVAVQALRRNAGITSRPVWTTADDMGGVTYDVVGCTYDNLVWAIWERAVGPSLPPEEFEIPVAIRHRTGSYNGRLTAPSSAAAVLDRLERDVRLMLYRFLSKDLAL